VVKYLDMKPLKSTLFALMFLCITPRLFATEVVVAAASDLSAAAKEIVADFEKRTGHTVKLTLGSSGNFYTQISNGAPFDVFLSADVAYVRDLEKAGLTEPGSSFVYGIGRIVLWVPRSSPIDVQTLGMKALLQPTARRIAIANPEHAPYGRAAVSAMERSGVYTSVKSKIVLGENISQTAQFVQSGAADIGIVALSLALTDTMKSQGKYFEIPLDSYPRMEQSAVMLKQAGRAGHTAAARAFLETLRSAEGREVLQRYGFAIPSAAGARN
jgi:molybdate transport system substrate-binding protein